jgi:DNA invertase Pin-like site-specific DNA recombinase
MGAMRYGYARTSTGDQTTALQLAALKGARCAHVYEDNAAESDFCMSNGCWLARSS